MVQYQAYRAEADFYDRVSHCRRPMSTLALVDLVLVDEGRGSFFDGYLRLSGKVTQHPSVLSLTQPPKAGVRQQAADTLPCKEAFGFCSSILLCLSAPFRTNRVL